MYVQRRAKGAALMKEHNLQVLEQRMKLPRLQTIRYEGKQFEDAASGQTFWFVPNIKGEGK